MSIGRPIRAPLKSGSASLLLLVLSLATGVPTGATVAAPADEVAYRQPFEYGDIRTVTCGNGHGSHADVWGKYSIDYGMDRGTPVVASADGTVLRAEAPFGETGKNEETNQIVLRHADGLVSVYRHLDKGGVFVKAGDEVLQGDLIGLSGNSGATSGPHLHFGLQSRMDGPSVPLRFADFAGDGSRVPKYGNDVTSYNFPVRFEKEHFALVDATFFAGVARDLDATEFAAEELLASRTIAFPRPQKVLQREIESRDKYVKEFEDAAAAALLRGKEARAKGELPAALRAAWFGERDYALSGRGKEFEEARISLQAERGFEAALSSFGAEREYRTLVLAALRAERDAVSIARRNRPAALRGQVWEPLAVNYAGVPARFEKALPAAPDRIRYALEQHIEWLRGKAK